MRRRDFFQRTQKKRYDARSHENPYFLGKGRVASWKGFMMISGSLICLFGLMIFFFSSSLFDVTSIHVRGVQNLKHDLLAASIRQNMNERVGLIFHRQNRFLFNKEKFLTALNKLFTFRDVRLDLAGNQIEIYVVERTSQLIWSTKSASYLVDLDGIIISTLEDETLKQLEEISMPRFVDRNDIHVQIGQKVLTTEEIEAVFRFHDHLIVQKINFSQTQFDRLSGKWVGVLTDDKYLILFDATGDVDAQAGRLETILKEKVTDTSLLEYIDLRFGDHVYFK